MASFDENGKYIKTNWKAGDKITATKLNKIEESIEAVNDNDISRHVEADARLDALEAKDVAHDKEFTNIKNTIADNKAAAELGDYEINSRMTFLEDELNEGIEEVHNVAETVDGKIATAEANMTAQVNQGKADMEAMVAEVEADLEGLHAKDEELSEQLAHIEKKSDICAYDYGIVQNKEISKEEIENYFNECDRLGIGARFLEGEYILNCSNVRLPNKGIEGIGRFKTVLKINPTDANPIFTIGEDDGWGIIRGDIRNIRFEINEEYTNDVLVVNNPDRCFQIDNVSIKNVRGVGILLLNSYYVNIKDTVVEGVYRASLPTDTTNLYEGIGIRNTTQVNNITITKCYFKYLSNVIRCDDTLYNGSNTVSINDSTMETIGDTIFVIPGYKAEINNCYFEDLDLNRDVADRPNSSYIVVLDGGGGQTTFNNCLINLSHVREDSNMIKYVLGSVTFNQGSVTGKPSSYKILRDTTYSSRGTIIDNLCAGLSQNTSFLMRWNQQYTNRYVPYTIEDAYSNLITESKYAKNTLVFHSTRPKNEIWQLNSKLPIVSVEGSSNNASHLVVIKATLYRMLPKTLTFGWKQIEIRFLINSDFPETITPIVTDVNSGGDVSAFIDSNINSKIIAQRVTNARTDFDNGYKWHYQVHILNEEQSGAYSKVLANDITTSILWIYANGDENHPDYSIYPNRVDWSEL